MKKFAKRFLSILLLSALTITYLFMLTGCANIEYELDGVTYQFIGGEGVCRVSTIDDRNIEGDRIYVRDIIKGCTVSGYGHASIGRAELYQSTGEIAVRIYFPWSLKVFRLDYWYSKETDVTEYIITASVDYIVSKEEIKNRNGGGKYVVPYITYEAMENGEFRTKINSEEIKNFIPANISYHFNYEDEPNKGYFFIDIHEETGKLIKPPYDPQREGYDFEGWYLEPECVNEWDFENDKVNIKYDEDGNRIYKEFELYAKWKGTN